MNQVQLACTLFLMMSQAFAGNPVLHYLDKPFPAKSSTLGEVSLLHIFLPIIFLLLLKNHFR